MDKNSFSCTNFKQQDSKNNNHRTNLNEGSSDAANLEKAM